MEDDVRKRMRVIELLAKGDDSYYFIFKELRDLAKRYEAVYRHFTMCNGIPSAILFPFVKK